MRVLRKENRVHRSLRPTDTWCGCLVGPQARGNAIANMIGQLVSTLYPKGASATSSVPEHADWLLYLV